jgi:hypothetical protein
MAEENKFEKAEKAADAALERSVLNILDVVRDRAYPRHEVTVYMDEQNAWLGSQIDMKLKEDQKLTVEERAALEDQLDEILAELQKSAYVFKLRGISEERREELLKMCEAEHPYKFTETKNPFTGQVAREEQPNEDRDQMFNDLLWHAHIEAIVGPDGSEQVGLSSESARTLRKNLPIAAATLIGQGIIDVRESTAIFMAKADDAFFPKP